MVDLHWAYAPGPANIGNPRAVEVSETSVFRESDDDRVSKIGAWWTGVAEVRIGVRDVRDDSLNILGRGRDEYSLSCLAPSVEIVVDFVQLQHDRIRHSGLTVPGKPLQVVPKPRDGSHRVPLGPGIDESARVKDVAHLLAPKAVREADDSLLKLGQVLCLHPEEQ